MSLPPPTPKEPLDIQLNYLSREVARLEMEKDKLQKRIDYIRELEASLAKQGLDRIFG